MDTGPTRPSNELLSGTWQGANVQISSYWYASTWEKPPRHLPQEKWGLILSLPFLVPEDTLPLRWSAKGKPDRG